MPIEDGLYVSSAISLEVYRHFRSSDAFDNAFVGTDDEVIGIGRLWRSLDGQILQTNMSTVC